MYANRKTKVGVGTRNATIINFKIPSTGAVRCESANKKDMAKLLELAKNIQTERIIVNFERANRQYKSYNKRVDALSNEDGRVLVGTCKTKRSPKKARNRYSAEEAGTCGMYITSIKGVVCRSSKIW